MAPPDPATQSNYTSIRTTHFSLDWSIDWTQRLISGSVTHALTALEDGVQTLVLDTSYLDIRGVRDAQGADLKWSVPDEHHPVLGKALTIELGRKLANGDQASVTVEYSTTSDCTAIGWLEPAQTAGGKHPYLYSQCQAIHARSLLPCQDTPGVKATYSARVHSNLPALMSARRVSPASTTPLSELLDKPTTYTYNQPVPIPSYLIALAAGRLAFRPFPPKSPQGVGKWTTGVWTEPELMDKSFWEFSEDTAKYIHQAEKIVTPYEWGIYDLLLLPPSFPYGGMENACLTFVTPTLLAGDRSLTDVVAHEASHSWFGNNIGCASWQHFWLNEGWTTYMERLLLHFLHGPAERDFSYIIGQKALVEALEQFKDSPKYQRLVIPYTFGEDPDEAFSSIPYDKGSQFLLHLEQTVGGLDVFLPYVLDYVKTFRGRSITTDDWRAHLFNFFRKQPGGDELVAKLEAVDWEGWLHGEGMKVPVDLKFDTSLADSAYALAKRWDAARDASPEELAREFSPEDVKKFTSNQKVVFLEKLHSLTALPPALVEALDKQYALDAVDNAEIRLRFYLVALKSGSEYAPRAAGWVAGQGRMKMCRPTYRALYKVAPELARRTFEQNEGFYHPIAAAQLRRDLGLAGKAQ